MRGLNLILALTTIALLSGCSENTKVTDQNIAAINVIVEKASQNSNTRFISASGKTESANSANLSTRMMGYVTGIKVKVGQQVTAGQLLITINNADLLAKKAQVEASVLQATAAYNNAKKDYDRFVNLFEKQSASQKELDDVTAQYEMTKAGLEGARQMRNEVIAQFDYSNIVAPFSGVITNTFVKTGDMANPGVPLVSIEGASGNMQVTAMVSESDIWAVKNGMKVKLLIKSINKEVDATVTEVSLSSKNTGGQYLVKINMEKVEKEILSGMFVNVKFPLENNKPIDNSAERVFVNKNALINFGQLTGIYTIGHNNVAILRWLRTGMASGESVEVLSGLSADEQYIVSADSKLYNGAKIAF